MPHAPPMAAASTPHPMTLEEWAALDEDADGELVDGRLAEEEMADATHERIVVLLVVLLEAWAARRDGFVLGSDARFGVTPRRGRKPDLSVYLGGRRPPARGLIRVPPDIAVEVVSSAPRDEPRDRVDKPDEYAAFGVSSYWLVDPALRTFEVWELGTDGRYARALGATDGTATIPGHEGLAVDLDALWAEAARLEAEGAGPAD